MKKELVKYLRPFSSKLVRGYDSRNRTNIVVFVRADENDDYIVGKVDKGGYDEKAGCWISKLEEEKISVSEVFPCDKIRFITPRYEALFEVNNLDMVLLDGQPVRVIAVDGGDIYHFRFDLPGVMGSVWHICEFAEKQNEHGNRVKQIDA